MGYLGVYVRMYINRGGDKNMEKRVGVSMNNYDDVEIRMEEYIDIYSMLYECTREMTINKDKLRRWR